MFDTKRTHGRLALEHKSHYLYKIAAFVFVHVIVFLVLFHWSSLVWQNFRLKDPRCSRPQSSKTDFLNVGVLVMATGNYADYVSSIVTAGRQYFLSTTSCSHSKAHYRVTYFIFTDKLEKMPLGSDVVPIYQERLRWPGDSMFRCSIYVNASEHYHERYDPGKRMDYLLSMDADTRFVRPVGTEILGDSIGVIHPELVGVIGPFEKNPVSTAFIESPEKAIYYTGAVFGGKTDKFLEACSQMDKNIRKDLAKGIIAIYHDESHLNRYFIDNPPTRKLSPIHHWPEQWRWNVGTKILAVQKNNGKMRETL